MKLINNRDINNFQIRSTNTNKIQTNTNDEKEDIDGYEWNFEWLFIIILNYLLKFLLLLIVN